MRVGLRLLYAAAAGLLLVGASVRIAAEHVWAPDPGVRADERPAESGGVPAQDERTPGTTGLAEAVVSTNLFSPRRSAPATRFTDSAPAPPPAATASPRRILRLFGVAMTGGRVSALIDADPLVPGAEIYHEGDALPGGGRVVRIASDHVVIETSEGRERLRMLAARPGQPPTSSPPEGP